MFVPFSFVMDLPWFSHVKGRSSFKAYCLLRLERNIHFFIVISSKKDGIKLHSFILRTLDTKLLWKVWSKHLLNNLWQKQKCSSWHPRSFKSVKMYYLSEKVHNMWILEDFCLRLESATAASAGIIRQPPCMMKRISNMISAFCMDQAFKHQSPVKSGCSGEARRCERKRGQQAGSAINRLLTTASMIWIPFHSFIEKTALCPPSFQTLHGLIVPSCVRQW